MAAPRHSSRGPRLLFSQAYLTALGTTNWISLIVTMTVLVIGYPIAYYLTTATGIGVRIVVLSIVLPYFTSIIVRTFSWMVLLGEHGLVNESADGERVDRGNRCR